MEIVLYERELEVMEVLWERGSATPRPGAAWNASTRSPSSGSATAGSPMSGRSRTPSPACASSGSAPTVADPELVVIPAGQGLRHRAGVPAAATR